jgi:hypothetical protein
LKSIRTLRSPGPAQRSAISAGLDPEPTARALIGMNLQYFFEQLADEPRAGVEETAETVLQIWARTLYGRSP